LAPVWLMGGARGARSQPLQPSSRAEAPQPGLQLTPEEELLSKTLQVEALERELREQTTYAEEEASLEQEARAKVEQLEQDLQDRETTTFAVVADMARQYKATQEALIFKINALETQLMEHQDEFEISSHQLRELALDQDEVLQAKDAQIRQLHERIDSTVKAAHRALKCRHYSLFDIRIDVNEQPYILEACLFCSFSPLSVIPSMAAQAGREDLRHPNLFHSLLDRAAAESKAAAPRQLSNGESTTASEESRGC